MHDYEARLADAQVYAEKIAKLQAEVERLTKERDTIADYGYVLNVAQTWQDAKKREKKLQETVERLRGALQRIEELRQRYAEAAHSRGSSGETFWDLMGDLGAIAREALR